MQHENQRSLPLPDADSRAQSRRVRDHIRAKIDAAGGQISFAEFMHEALYTTGLGYYVAGSSKFGADGDFVTAPEVSALFGSVVARQCAEVLAMTEQGSVLEFGAGSGKLAVDMLQTFEALGTMPTAYNILEVSAELRARQESRLRACVPHLLERVSWLPEMPGNHVGVIIANEVLDALPVERFVKRHGEIQQQCVAYDESNDDGGFFWTIRPATKRLRCAVVEIEADLGQPLAEGYNSEISLAMAPWIADVVQCLQQGAVFLFDYGVSRSEYYAPDRSAGWLRCHFRHYAHSDPFVHPGIQDLTTWVDFSAVAAAAVANDARILGYQSQSHFLIGGGLEIEMQGFSALPLRQQTELSGQIKTLTLPGEMGENFKCIALSRGEISTPSAFRLADRTQTL